jgi:hypothetical protein
MFFGFHRIFTKVYPRSFHSFKDQQMEQEFTSSSLKRENEDFLEGDATKKQRIAGETPLTN